MNWASLDTARIELSLSHVMFLDLFDIVNSQQCREQEKGLISGIVVTPSPAYLRYLVFLSYFLVFFLSFFLSVCLSSFLLSSFLLSFSPSFSFFDTNFTIYYLGRGLYNYSGIYFFCNGRYTKSVFKACKPGRLQSCE